MTATDASQGTREQQPSEKHMDRRQFVARAAAAGAVLAGSGAFPSGALAAGKTAARAFRRSGSSSTLYVANYGDMQNLDPYTSSGDEVTGDILTNLYAIPATFDVPSKLGPQGIRYANPNAFVGQAAESWTTNKAGTEVTFTMRKGLKFPDGTPLDASAVKFSLDRNLSVKATGAFLFGMIGITSPDQFEVLDSQHFRIKLPKPTSLLFGNMAMFYGSAILNPTIVKQHETSADPNAESWMKTNTAESGWYTLKSWNVGTGWTLQANPSYWGQVRTPTVQFEVIPDASQRELLVKSGQVDLALGVPLKDVPALRKDTDLTVLSIPSRAIAFAGMNVDVKPFDNVLVRQALNYAVPYQTIMQDVLLGQGIQLKSPISYGMPNLNTSYWHYNTDYTKAKELLAKAGYPHGFSTSLAISNGNPIDQQTAEWIQQGLAKAGVDVTINMQPQAAFTAQLQAKTHDFWFSSNSWISINNDPMYQLYWLFAQSCCTYGNYVDPQVVSLINKYVDAPRNDPARIAAINKLQQLIVDAAPWIFLYQPPQIYVMRNNVKGFVFYSTDLFNRYATLYKT